MEPYKPKKLPLEYTKSNDLINLLNDAYEVYGEYKGYLKNMEFDYSSFLESLFINELYYSFKIDGAKIEMNNMFHMPYVIKNNDSIEFNNMKRAFLSIVSDINSGPVSLDSYNKINKILFTGCRKDNLTKGSGMFRKSQNYILKPGIAGSNVSFIPPIYTDINPAMKNLVEFINGNYDNPFLTSIITHFQFEKIHPYVSGNGKIGRLMIPVIISYKRKDPPILFISESLDKLKNTYFTLLSDEIGEDLDKFNKFMLQAIIEQCNMNIKKIKILNKIYKKDKEDFKTVIGGTTIDKVYPVILKRIVFTTNDIVEECKLHINSVNKVLNKLVDTGYLIKEKKDGTNRVTFCYKNFYDVFMN